MYEDTDFYESKLEDLYESLEKASDLAQELQDDKESLQNNIEK